MSHFRPDERGRRCASSSLDGRRRAALIVAAIVFVLALALRLWIAVEARWWPIADAHAYHVLAANLVTHGEYTDGAQSDDGRASSQNERRVTRAYRAPGYPLFVAAIYSAFGAGNHPAVFIANAMLESLAMALLFLVARRLWPDRQGAAAIALALFAPYVAWTPNAMSESLFVALVMATLALVTMPRELTRIETIGAALVILAAFVVRPVGIVLVIVVLFSPPFGFAQGKLRREEEAKSANSPRRREGREEKGKNLCVLCVFAVKKYSIALLALLFIALYLVAWGERNRAVLGERFYSTTNFGWHNAPSFGVSRADSPCAQIDGEIARDACYRDAIKANVTRKPLLAAWVYATRVAQLFDPAPTYEVWAIHQRRTFAVDPRDPTKQKAAGAVYRALTSFTPYLWVLYGLGFAGLALGTARGFLRRSTASHSHSCHSERAPCHSERSEESPARVCHSERSEESPARVCHSERSEESPARVCHSERSEESRLAPPPLFIPAFVIAYALLHGVVSDGNARFAAPLVPFFCLGIAWLLAGGWRPGSAGVPPAS
ncbi:glycosyltransferase family 39 protein [bacterium]|nr:glycosyltransferase family 39 protein [bacterium]